MAVGGDTNFALHEGARGDGEATAVIAFAVDDLDSEIDRLSAGGIAPVDQVNDTGAARFATFIDPDGNRIQLLERRIDSHEH
jgi:predicted enzyme related to lactoylglutathione lyase